MASLSRTLANAILDYYSSLYPSGSVLEMRSGPGAGADNPASGKLIATVTAPERPWRSADKGEKDIDGEWIGKAITTGKVGHYRFTCGPYVSEGSVGELESGADMEIPDPRLAIGQVVVIRSFTKTL